MFTKTWNVRDAPTEELKRKAESEYKTIIKYDKFIKKAVSIEEAKQLVEEKFRHKAFVSEIELEIMRRRANGEETF